MAFPFARILCPVDFDGSTPDALTLSAEIARQNDGVVMLLHVIPTMVSPADIPTYVDLYKGQEEGARERLQELAHRYFKSVKYELATHIGEVTSTILHAERNFGADVVVMASHGRRGLSRVFLGSVTEMVLRESTCPVIVVRGPLTDRAAVGHWMTSNPQVATPDEKLSAVDRRMQAGGFRSMPVLEGGKLVGIISDRDIRRHVGYLDHTEVKLAMTTDVLTVTPRTPLKDVARLLRERKVGGMPVTEDGALVGVITTSDVLRAFTEID